MAFMMEKILTDARKLANRLKEHDGSTDNLVTQMTTLNKKIDSMKTFQENLPDLNELVLRKPRSTVKLGLSQENSQIRELEQENKELKQSLEEHELALELIMSRYRQQVAKLLVSNKVDESMMYKETVQAQEVQDKAEHIHEMGSVMWKAISDDDRSMYDTQQLLAQLRIENDGMRELLHICSSSGNPLRISDRQTQTDGLSLFSSTIHNESSAVSPAAASGACRGGNAPCTPSTTVATGATMKVLTALKSLKLGEKDSLRDGSVAGGASKAGEEKRDEQASVVGSLETASAFVLPSDAFASSSQSTSSEAQESNSPEKMTSSNSPEKMASSNSPEKMMTSSNSPEKMMTSSNSSEKMMTSSNSSEKMMTSSNSPEKMTSSSEPCSSQGLTTTASNEDQQQTSLGKGTVEVSPVSSSSAVVVTDKSNEVEEQQPTIPCASESADMSSSQETLSEPTTTTPRLPELVLENHADENHIPNDDDEVVETLATDDGQLRPSVVESVVVVGATQELDNSPRASSSSPLSNTTTASSTTSSTTTESTSSSPQSRHLASSSTLKNQTNSPKSAALSIGKHASSPSGGTPRNPSSGHVTPQKTAATPSSGSSTSRLKHGATTTPSGVPSKTPTRSPAARDSAPGSSSGAATAVKLTGSPSVHSAKTSAAAHSPRATPIRIKAARQPSPVVASVASPATNSSPSTTTTTTSCVPLDSNGNSHTTTSSSTTVLNEISNINNMPKDATVDGQ